MLIPGFPPGKRGKRQPDVSNSDQACHRWLLLAPVVLIVVLPLVDGQSANTVLPLQQANVTIGNTFTRVTATYDLGSPGTSSWLNISQANFQQVLIPSFQAARPATTATWVQANTADLTHNLRTVFSGIVPKQVQVDNLKWELAKPVLRIFPGATADITASTVGNATTGNLVKTYINLTYTAYPPAGAPHNATAAGVIALMQSLLNTTPALATPNAALYIRNITEVKGNTSRITNATLSYVVPSGSQARDVTFYPLLGQLRNQSGWQLIALKTEDVSSFFVGRPATYNVSVSVCDLTRDSCCSNCDITKGCVKKPLCVPKDLSLTLDDQLCMAPSNIPCQQRSQECGNYYFADIAPFAERLYEYSRGFWDFSIPAFYAGQSQPSGGNYISDTSMCAPYRIVDCFNEVQPERCKGMCTLMQQAICNKDVCTSWDAVNKVAVTDPCCGELDSAQCEKTPLPFNVSAVCQWDAQMQSCRMRIVDNCTSAALSLDDQVLCKISNIMKSNAGRNLTNIAANLCSGAVTKLCEGPASQSTCNFCLAIQSKLIQGMTTTVNQATYCSSKGDASARYTTTSVQRKQSQLMKIALQLLLTSSTMCSMVANALLPAGGYPLLSADNVQAHGGAWVCNATMVADQLCKSNEPAASSSSGSSGIPITHTYSSSMPKNNSLDTGGYSDSGRDCSACGSYIEQFAASAAAGNCSYNLSSVQSFCIHIQEQEHQANLAAGQADDLVEDTCAATFLNDNNCDVERGCELKTQCLPTDTQATMNNTACTALSTNSAGCNQMEGCVFVPTIRSQGADNCARIAAAVRKNAAALQTWDPVNICQNTWFQSTASLWGTCASPCLSGGYCTTIGAHDPQCATACGTCNNCLSSVSYVREALNISETHKNPSVMGTTDTVTHLEAYKACMIGVLDAGAASANVSNGTSAGQCMAQQDAACSVARTYNYCNQIGDCQQTRVCKKIDITACDPTAPTWPGFACKVVTLCDRLLNSPDPLPAATFCGPQYLDSCTTSSTSFECRKCLKDAEDVQMHLRTSAVFECHSLNEFFRTKVQECTTFVGGWFGAKKTCPAIPQVWDEFQAVNSNLSYSLYYWSSMYEDPELVSQKYVGFCSSLQNAASNISTKLPTLPNMGRRLLSTTDDNGSNSPPPARNKARPEALTQISPTTRFPASSIGSQLLTPAPVPQMPGAAYSGTLAPSMPTSFLTPYARRLSSTESGSTPVSDNSNGTPANGNPNNSPAEPCQYCNKGPDWVYDVLEANVSDTCFTRDNLMFCHPSSSGTNCSGDASQLKCSRIIQCPEDRLSDCMEPLLHATSRMIPMLQLQNRDPNRAATYGLVEWSSVDSGAEKFYYDNYLPFEAVLAADAFVHAKAIWPFNPKLPPRFGCPDWPPVREAMGQPAFPVGYNATANRAGESGDMSPNSPYYSSNNTGIQRTMCWADATVAMNLMVASSLERFFWVNPLGNVVYTEANPPWSSIHTWTVYWMPPNLPCTTPDKSGCLNQTYTFQLERWAPCESLYTLNSNRSWMSSLERRWVPAAPNALDNTGNGSEYCHYDPRLFGNSPDFNFAMATFAPEGPLGFLMNTTLCNIPSGTDENATLADLDCHKPPIYPINTDTLPEPLFAMPFSSYEQSSAGSQWLQQSKNVPLAYPGAQWCSPNVQSCADRIDNGGEGYFLKSHNTDIAGNISTVYTYYAYNQGGDEGDPNYGYYMYMPTAGWDQYSCRWEVPTTVWAMKGGYVAKTAFGLYEACVDYRPAQGPRGSKPEYSNWVWSGENTCNQWSDSCCSPVGLKPGNLEVCESQGSCRFSVSCTVSSDNCYNQFNESWSDATNYAVCDPACSFQLIASVADTTQFLPLPTLRTAADGSVTIQQGICYNMTTWAACAAKGSEATCKLWSDGNNTCSWAPTCQQPTTSNFGCHSSTDTCCLESSTANFTADQVTDCTGQQGDNGKPCKVDRQCYQLRDPCTSKVTPWDCLADVTCQFTATANSRMGGTCTTLRQSDPCTALTTAACNSTAACAVADRCVTDRCSDPEDTCCALSGKDTACRSDPSCLVTSTCLPATDECAMFTNATLCQLKTFCSWQPLQPADATSDTSSDSTSVGCTSQTSNVTDNSTRKATSETDCTTPPPTPASNADNSTGLDDTGPTMELCVMDVTHHPCTAANDQQTCLGLLDVVGRPRCYTQGNCLSLCSRCAECLKVTSTVLGGALAGQLIEPAATSANKVSQVFNSWCTNQGFDTAVCDRLTAAVAMSYQGNLARRPGMLCNLAGQCPISCTIPVEGASGAISRQALDLCTSTGTAAGMPVPPVVQNSSFCLSDGDCTGGSWCDLGTAYNQVCSCVAGADVCNLKGTCNSDLCPRLSALTSINKDLTSCTTNADCTVGLVCLSRQFKTYSCINSIVTPTAHTGYCAETVPSLLTAQLDDSAASITVALSAPAAGFTTDCSGIFTAATVAKIGRNAICVAAFQKQMTILLQNAPGLIWGTDKLELRQDQSTLVSSVGARPFVGNSSAVATCTNCPAPLAILQGPQLITKPCVGTDPTDVGAVYFDASGSQGTAAAPISNVDWQLIAQPYTTSEVQNSIADALAGLAAKTDVRDKMVLKLTGSVLNTADPGDYTLMVTVTNSLGQTASTFPPQVFTVADAGAKPSISVFAPGSDATGAVITQPSKGLKLYSQLQLDSVCKGTPSKVNYLWTCTAADGRSCTLPADAAAVKQLMLNPSDLAGFGLGLDYTFTLTAGFTGSTATSADSMVVRFARSPLTAVLLGPTGDIPLKNFTVDASKSSDPDSPTASLKFDFTCSPQPCFKDVTYTGSRPKQSAWTLDASQLAVISQEYTIAVTVSGTAPGDTRQASVSLSVIPRPGNPPTGIAARFCGYDATGNLLNCPARQNPMQNLVITLLLNPGFEAASVQWAIGGDNAPQLVEGVNGQGIRTKTLTVYPTALPPTGSIKLQAAMRMPGVNGTASIAVAMNNPPTCPQPPCFFTDINSTVFPAYSFVGTASGWQDADGDVLTYEFGQLANGNYRSRTLGPSTTYVFKGFEPGSYQLYSCAVDSSGARTCASANIEVLQLSTTTAEQKAVLVEQSVGKIDVGQLASTGDAGAVADAMLEFASLATYSTSTAAPNPSLGAATSTNTSAVLSNKQDGLLNALVKVMSNKDPAAMSNSMNAADKVSDALPNGLSAQAGGALISVAEGFVAANAAATDVNADQLKTATKLVFKGTNSASNIHNGATAGRRRALLASSSTDPAAYNRMANTLTGLMNIMSSTTPMGGSRIAGTSDICMSVTRGNAVAGDLDGQLVLLDCTLAFGAANTGRRARSLHSAAPGVAAITMPQDFSTACAADPVCNQSTTNTMSQTYIADPALSLGSVKDWPASSLLSGAQSDSELKAISGVYTLGMDNKNSGPICGTSTCLATVELPVANYNSSLDTTCLRLDPLLGDSTAHLQAGVPLVIGNVTSNKVSCFSNSLGKVVVVQYTPAPAARVVETSASNTTAQNATGQNSTSGATGDTVILYDNSTLDQKDAGEPIDFTFTFSTYNYNALFKPNGAVDNAAIESFKQAVKESFLAGIANRTSINVKSADNKLQLNRVSVLDVRPGSVVADVEFIPPVSATLAAISSFKLSVTSNTSDYFSTPAFTQAYGAPQVTGQIAAPSKSVTDQSAMSIGLGVGIGVGGALLLVSVLAIVICRHRQTQMTVTGSGSAPCGRQWSQI